MGFLDKLFNRDAKWYKDRAAKLKKEGDYGQALLDIEKALELDTDHKLTEKLEKMKAGVRKTMYEQAMERARGLIRAKNYDAAQNCMDLAKRYADTDEQKDAISKLVDDADSAAEAENAIKNQLAAMDQNVSALTFEEKWKLYVSQLTFAQAQQFDELGQSFKEAWISLQDGKVEEAIKGFKAVLEEHENDPTVMLELGRAYYINKDLRNAEKILTKADHVEDRTDIKLLRAEVLWRMNRFDIAEIVLQSAYDHDPDNHSVLAAIAQHGLMSKDYESGIDAVEVLLDELPDDISVKRLAARLYEANGDDEKALDMYETVNRIFWRKDPQTRKLQFDPQSVDGAANLYIKLDKNIPRAIELLNALREGTDGLNHVAVCLRLSEVYEKQNKKSKVSELLNEAQRIMDSIDDKGDPMTAAIAAVLHQRLHPEEKKQDEEKDSDDSRSDEE